MNKAILVTLMLLTVSSVCALDRNAMLTPTVLDRNVMPESYQDAENRLGIFHNFIMWTYDGSVVLWGKYSNEYFIGESSLGGKMYGVYTGNNFQGYYDGEPFSGVVKNKYWWVKNPDTGQTAWGMFILF